MIIIQAQDSTLSTRKIVKTQRNSTQLNPTLKQLALELDTVVTCTPPTPPHPTTNFQPLLDQLESWNLAETLTRPTWLRKPNQPNLISLTWLAYLISRT